MSGSAHSVAITQRPRILGVRATILALVLAAALLASFAIGRASVPAKDTRPVDRVTPQTYDLVGEPGHRHGDVKRG